MILSLFFCSNFSFILQINKRGTSERGQLARNGNQTQIDECNLRDFVLCSGL